MDTEALSKKTQADANKPEPEKQKAKQEAEVTRKLANDAKAAHDNIVNSKLNPSKRGRLPQPRRWLSLKRS